MKNKNTTQKGREAEDFACAFLENNGYKIIERNFNTRFGEIDIIAQKDKTLHFVEVKSRTTPVQGEPEEAVNALKQRNIVKAARRYMAMREDELSDSLESWFDVAAVTFDGGDIRINYFPGAFIPIFV